MGQGWDKGTGTVSQWDKFPVPVSHRTSLCPAPVFRGKQSLFENSLFGVKYFLTTVKRRMV